MSHVQKAEVPSGYFSRLMQFASENKRGLQASAFLITAIAVICFVADRLRPEETKPSPDPQASESPQPDPNVVQPAQKPPQQEKVNRPWVDWATNTFWTYFCVVTDVFGYGSGCNNKK